MKPFIIPSQTTEIGGLQVRIFDAEFDLHDDEDLIPEPFQERFRDLQKSLEIAEEIQRLCWTCDLDTEIDRDGDRFEVSIDLPHFEREISFFIENGVITEQITERPIRHPQEAFLFVFDRDREGKIKQMLS